MPPPNTTWPAAPCRENPRWSPSLADPMRWQRCDDSEPLPAMMPATCVPWPLVSTRLSGASGRIDGGTKSAMSHCRSAEIRMRRVNARVVHLHHHVRAGQIHVIRRRLTVSADTPDRHARQIIRQRTRGWTARRSARRAACASAVQSVGGMTRTTGPNGDRSGLQQSVPPSFSIC